jgi:hypothetical protein
MAIDRRIDARHAWRNGGNYAISSGVNYGLAPVLVAHGAIFTPQAAPRWRSADRAALYPFIPCTPAPGGVAAEQM